jgi:hexulose-6-phosphate isomerase
MDQLSRRDFLQKSTAMALAAGTAISATASHAAPDTTPTQPAAAPAEGKGKFVLKTAIKTSILKKVAGENAGWEEKLNLAKETGFQGVEWDDITTPDEGAKMQELAKKIGVPCHGVVYGGWQTPLSDPDPKVIQAGIDGMKNAISSANAIGVETCLLVPAVVKPEVQYDVAYKRSQDNVRKLIEHAEQNKVIICLENVWNKFLLSPMEFARYIDEIGSPAVRMYFDVSNSLVQGYSEHWMRIMGNRIRKCDVKDFSRKEHRFVPVGEGDVNFPEVTKILNEWGYNDYLTSESNVKTKEELADSCKRLEKVFQL